jgi:hypothetical protein
LTKVGSEVVLFEEKNLETREREVEKRTAIVDVGRKKESEGKFSEEGKFSKVEGKISEEGGKFSEGEEKFSEEEEVLGKSEVEGTETPKRKVLVKFSREEKVWEKFSDEEESEDGNFTKVFFGGVAGTPDRVRPEGDDGTCKGSPASRPEPRAESQGGMGLMESESERAKDATTRHYEDLILSVGRRVERSASVSRPPSPMVSSRTEVATQTENIDVDSAPCSEMHGPRREEALSRIEHMVRSLRQGQARLASDRKRAKRARQRREKRRRKEVVFTEGKQSDGPKGPVDSSVVPEVGGSQPPLDIWEPPTEESDNRTEGGGSDRTAGNRTDGNPVEVGAQRPRKSPPVLSEPQREERDAKRLLRALRKIAHDKLRERKEGREEEKAVPSRVFITLEDRVGISHLAHRIGVKEELHTATKNLRKSLIRIFRLKNLVWELYRQEREQWVKLPKLVQVMQEGAVFRLIIVARKQRRPNAPGSSKRRHFERANRGKRKVEDFSWRPEEGGAQKKPEPRVEPPRPPGWKPLIIAPELVRTSEEGLRKLADRRMKEWSKDHEEYTEQQLREVQKKKEKNIQKIEEEAQIRIAEEEAQRKERVAKEAQIRAEEEAKRKERVAKRCQELEEARAELRQEAEALEKEEQVWAEREKKILKEDSAFAAEHCPPRTEEERELVRRVRGENSKEYDRCRFKKAAAKTRKEKAAKEFRIRDDQYRMELERLRKR